jgi:TM2 domain-containing membrane protein YozV
MDNQTNLLFMNCAKYFPEESIPAIRQTLEEIGPQRAQQALAMEYKDPTVALILSLVCFLGFSGIDRFYIGDIGYGVAKFITAGGCGIWAIIDLFLITGATKEKNYGTYSIYSPNGRGRQETIRRTLQRLWHEQQHRLQHVRPCRHQE